VGWLWNPLKEDLGLMHARTHTHTATHVCVGTRAVSIALFLKQEVNTFNVNLHPPHLAKGRMNAG
jgi:hypothetical protein